MRVKWNRNLDGIRPLITVPETDVLSNGKLEEVVECDDNKSSFTDLNENQTEPEVSTNGNTFVNLNDSLSVQTCESPSPSSASISSKRSDKSKPRISSLFALFKVKEKVINDNNSEDCVSNFSELSGATIPSLISPSLGKRKSNYGSRDSLIPNDKIGFEADTRRRRRANNLLARSSLRRSWQQLNVANKLPVGTTYIITKERLPNHCLIASHCQQLVKHKSSETHLLSRSSQMRPNFDISPEVSSNSGNVSKISSEEGSVETEANRTGSESSEYNPSSLEKTENKEMQNNVQTDVQTLQTFKSEINCISESDLNEKNGCGCDEVDKEVQRVVNTLDSEYILLKNSKMIFDPKNHKNDFKSINLLKNEPKLESDKTDAHIRSNAHKNGVQPNKIGVSIGVNRNNSILDAISVKTLIPKTDETTQTTPQLSTNRKSDKPNENYLNLNNSLNDNNLSNELSLTNDHFFQPSDQSSKHLIKYESDDSPVNSLPKDIIKVKVKKNQLPESEVVCFANSTQIVSSPSTVSAATIDNECNNDKAVVLTFINDEPMTSRDGSTDKENVKSDDIFVNNKSTPIQGILRVRSRESNSEENSTNSLTKTNEVNAKSRKKVHFADSCLQNRNSSHGRSRTVRARHYSSLGVVTSIDKRPSNRRPVHTSTTGSSLTSKRVTNPRIGATNVSSTKREIRSTHSSEDKQQIEKLTQLCETKTKQLKNLDINQNYMRLAFDSLTVVIQHLIEQFEPFETPKLKNALNKANTRCEQLKDNLNTKDVELNDMRLIFEEQINHLMKEREKNLSDLNQAKASHESSIKRLKEMHSFEVKRIEEMFEKQLLLSQQNCNQLINEIEDKTNELNETKQSKEVLEFKTKQMEENIMNDKDKKFKYLSEKSKQLELEVESLKAVMDMKNEKIHCLERKMIETQEKINELPTAKESVKCLQQHVETLQITLDRKVHQYNQLTREHEDLKEEFEKEMREKRRLSMKNEELTFHLNETLNESMISSQNNCQTPIDLYDSYRFKSPAPVRVLHNDDTPVRSIHDEIPVRTLHNDETPVKINRSISINSGQTPTASVRKSHSRVHRSVSASSKSSSSVKSSAFLQFPSSGPELQNNFVSNGITDEVFDNNGTSFTDCHRLPESNKKSVKVKRIEKLSDETAPQSIFDSGFEEIQGLNSLSK